MSYLHDVPYIIGVELVIGEHLLIGRTIKAFINNLEQLTGFSVRIPIIDTSLTASSSELARFSGEN